MPDAATITRRSARLLGPYQLLRAQTQTITCPMVVSGALVAPTGGTVSIYRPDGTAVVDGASVTVTGSIATYPVSAALLPATETPGTRWLVAWTLTFAAAPTTEVIEQTASLCRRAFYPTLTDDALYRRIRILDPSYEGCIHSLATFQDKIDEAVGIMLSRLHAAGQRPEQIVEPSAFQQAALNLTLALIFEDFTFTIEGETYATAAERYRAEYESLWGSLSYAVDRDDDGKTDGRRRPRGSIWLGGMPGLTS